MNGSSWAFWTLAHPTHVHPPSHSQARLRTLGLEFVAVDNLLPPSPRAYLPGVLPTIGRMMVPWKMSISQFSELVNVLLPYLEKQDFADVIKSRVLRWEHYPRISTWASAISRIFVSEREKQEDLSESDVTMEAIRKNKTEIRRHYTANFKDGGRSH